MDKVKTWVALAAALSVVVLAAGWYLLVQPQRSQVEDLRSQAQVQVDGNALLQTQLAVLRAQAEDLPEQERALAKVAARIPDDPALPTLIRELTAASKRTGVELVSLTPGAPTPVGAAPAADGSVTAGALLAVPLTLNVVGNYVQVQQFVAALEDLPRALRVSNLAIAPGADPVSSAKTAAATDGSSLVTVITGQVFTKVATAAPAAGGSPTTAPSTSTSSPAPVDSAPAS